jgi:hypothetical protein
MSSIPLFAPLGVQAPPVPGLPDEADLNPLLTRTHYFDGRLLTAADLTRDQLYLDGRLREIGQALGSGVVRGLEATLTGGRIEIAPGIAIAVNGRVLEVKAPIPLDLNNRALIAAQNKGKYLRLPRGLYALVLAYGEEDRGTAEVFPQDLAAREVQHDAVAEGVRASLVGLPVPLPQADPIAVRAGLMRALAEGGLGSALIPEDGVALGILAVRDDRPEWLDTTLLRHPARTAPGPGDLQADLHRQYEALLADVLARRRPLGGDFAASEYFRILPPTGRIPKAALDPATGRQRFFPEHFRVSVAPIRQGDLELVQRESLRLPAIDLARDEPVDLVVLAPLAGAAYGRLAAALEREATPVSSAADARVLLPHLDLLALRLYPLRPVHRIDTDAAVWQAIWAEIGETDPVFVRRPTRAAETGISGILLARGTTLPEPSPVPTEGPPEVIVRPPGGALVIPGTVPIPRPEIEVPTVLDADALLLSRVSLGRLVELRQPPDAAEMETRLPELRGTAGDPREAAETLVREHGREAPTVLAALDLLVLIERRFDALTWQTLLAAARREYLAGLVDALRELQGEVGTAAAVGRWLEGLGAREEPIPALIEGWRLLDDRRS